jgi:hypothetical protein
MNAQLEKVKGSISDCALFLFVIAVCAFYSAGYLGQIAKNTSRIAIVMERQK